mmetsp:Transcript_95745/g.259921  ORF Transcript_95745/g.259921 Transcript_95745/m.259921 type:complete len:274 (+) Transcript_95745:2345-3166(+)
MHHGDNQGQLGVVACHQESSHKEAVAAEAHSGPLLQLVLPIFPVHDDERHRKQERQEDDALPHEVGAVRGEVGIHLDAEADVGEHREECEVGRQGGPEDQEHLELAQARAVLLAHLRVAPAGSGVLQPHAFVHGQTDLLHAIGRHPRHVPARPMLQEGDGENVHRLQSMNHGLCVLLAVDAHDPVPDTNDLVLFASAVPLLDRGVHHDARDDDAPALDVEHAVRHAEHAVLLLHDHGVGVVPLRRSVVLVLLNVERIADDIADDIHSLAACPH